MQGRSLSRLNRSCNGSPLLKRDSNLPPREDMVRLWLSFLLKSRPGRESVLLHEGILNTSKDFQLMPWASPRPFAVVRKGERSLLGDWGMSRDVTVQRATWPAEGGLTDHILLCCCYCCCHESRPSLRPLRIQKSGSILENPVFGPVQK